MLSWQHFNKSSTFCESNQKSLLHIKVRGKYEVKLSWGLEPQEASFFLSIISWLVHTWILSASPVLQEESLQVISITVGFFSLHRVWISLHRLLSVSIPIQRMLHWFSVIPANDTKESMFGHWKFLAFLCMYSFCINPLKRTMCVQLHAQRRLARKVKGIKVGQYEVEVKYLCYRKVEIR